VVEQIETVPMSADEYEQAVDALATLIVKWARNFRGQDSVTPGHSDGD
jgi:hypothetical protein